MMNNNNNNNNNNINKCVWKNCPKTNLPKEMNSKSKTFLLFDSKCNYLNFNNWLPYDEEFNHPKGLFLCCKKEHCA